MIAYITIGVDDIESAKTFYSAFLPALDYELRESAEGLSFSIPPRKGKTNNLTELYIKAPFERLPASTGNGTMIAFSASSQQQVRNLYAAAIAAGGSDEGQSGFRKSYSSDFYVCYLNPNSG